MTISACTEHKTAADPDPVLNWQVEPLVSFTSSRDKSIVLKQKCDLDAEPKQETHSKTVGPLEDVRPLFIQCALQGISLNDRFPAELEASARAKHRACNRSELGPGAAHSGDIIIRLGHTVHWHGMAP